MKTILALFAFTLFSFTTQTEKKITLSFSLEEVQTIYDALGELPAKKVEALRIKILNRYTGKHVEAIPVYLFTCIPIYLSS